MKKVSSEKLVQDIRRRTRKKYSSEEKIRIVLEGMRGEENISELCRREGIASNLYYRWSKDFLDVGCGVGNLVWGFSRAGIHAEGNDISENAITRAPAEIKPFLKAGDILNLDYPDNAFDLVNCSDVLEHIPLEESDNAIQNLYRISNKWLVLNICLWTEKNARLDPTHINLHSKRWWAKRIKNLGYSILKTPDDFPSKRNAFIIEKHA